MEIIIIVLCCLLGGLVLHLICMKQSIRRLREDFAAVAPNRTAQRNLTLVYPEKELEQLAVVMNDFIGSFYEVQAQCQQNVKEIRSEITNLSHDLRTPLTSILGYLELLKPEELTEEQNQILEVVKRRGYQLNDLINELYEYARLENKEYAMRPERIDFHRMVREHLLESYLDFEQAGIDFVPDLLPELKPVWIQGDKKCLERVLTNLTSNTLKYNGGEAKVFLREEDGWVRLIYQTLRHDLSDFDVQHLFDRFYQKDTSRSDARSSGLGLTIAKLMVEQNEGTIYAKADDDHLFMILRFPIVK